nr:glycosyl transferase [PVC group bacterium]
WPAMNIFAQAFFLYIVVLFSLAKFVVFWWGQLTVLDIVTAMYCLAMENESLKLSLYGIPYRIYVVLLTDVCEVLASIEELLQIKMTWGKLERVSKI